MKLTVRDCLELDAFKPCTVAAGKRNLDKVVRSVSVLDARDVKTAIKNNGVREQLVLTSFYAMKDDVETQAKVVKELAGCGISGLVVFHATKGIRDQDSQTVEIAEATGLPLIVLAPNNKSGYAEAIEQIMDKMLVGDDQKNHLINNTIYHLLDFDKHKTFPAAIREAAISNDFQVVLVSKDFNPVLVVETRHHVTVVDAVRKLQKREEDDRGIYTMLDLEGIVAYWGSVNVGNEEYFLLIVDNEERYSAVEITKLAEIIELAMGMWKFTPERDRKTELIKALMRGNKSLAYSLKDEMDFSSDQKIVSVFQAKGIHSKEAMNIIEAFEDKTHSEVLSVTEGEETSGMILASKRTKDCEEGKGMPCIGLYDKLKELSKEVRIFHSSGMDSLESAADGFGLIGETWTFVESVFPYKRVFSKYELVLVSNCISIQVQGGPIKKNYSDLLEPFKREMGENKAKQLMDTLETFVLDAGMNSNKTAKLMGIHANTVQYRLKRINDVLGVDITANRVIPGLTVALALKRLERVLN